MAGEMCSHLNALILWAFARLFHFLEKKNSLRQAGSYFFLVVCGQYVCTAVFEDRQFSTCLHAYFGEQHNAGVHYYVIFAAGTCSRKLSGKAEDTDPN